mmetsp:Transcript_145732/g.466970  ORF Transcript_145732/g.466970 Transcript_145732/m.466970 type:complete len:384 (-) Transcript_145732:424-1575(-)
MGDRGGRSGDRGGRNHVLLLLQTTVVAAICHRCIRRVAVRSSDINGGVMRSRSGGAVTSIHRGRRGSGSMRSTLGGSTAHSSSTTREGIPEKDMLDDEFGGIACAVEGVLRHGLQRQLRGLEEAAIHEQGAEVSGGVQGEHGGGDRDVARWPISDHVSRILCSLRLVGPRRRHSQGRRAAAGGPASRGAVGGGGARCVHGRHLHAVLVQRSAAAAHQGAAHGRALARAACILREHALEARELTRTHRLLRREHEVADVLDAGRHGHRAAVGEGLPFQSGLGGGLQVHALGRPPHAGLRHRSAAEAHLLKELRTGAALRLPERHTEHNAAGEGVRAVLRLVKDKQLRIGDEAVDLMQPACRQHGIDRLVLHGHAVGILQLEGPD